MCSDGGSEIPPKRAPHCPDLAIFVNSFRMKWHLARDPTSPPLCVEKVWITCGQNLAHPLDARMDHRRALRQIAGDANE